MINIGKRIGTGQARKTAALDRHEAHRQQLLRAARIALLRRLLAAGTATIDDVRCEVMVPAGLSPQFFGSTHRPLVRLGLIEKVGYRSSERPETHARPIAVWGLVDRGGAARWIDRHAPVAVEVDSAGHPTLFPMR